MPKFDPASPTIDLTILEHPIKAPVIFTPGHALTEAEAKQLNRWTATAVSNGVPAAIKRLQAEDTKANLSPRQFDGPAIQALFDSRYTEFELGQSNRSSTGTNPTDPLSRYVRAMAVDFVNSRLKAKGKNIQTVRAAKDAEGNSVYEALLKTATERNPQWTELAQMQVDAVSEAAEDDFDIGTVGDVEAPATVTDPQPEVEPDLTPAE